MSGQIKVKKAGEWGGAFGSNGSLLVPGVPYAAGYDSNIEIG